MNALDEKGIDWLCDRLTDGAMQREICDELGINASVLARWIASDPSRSARVREARISAARFWEEMAGQVLESAEDQFGLAKAKELAHHYRWKASKQNPKDYGDKVTAEHVGADGGPVLFQKVVREIVDPAKEKT